MLWAEQICRASDRGRQRAVRAGVVNSVYCCCCVLAMNGVLLLVKTGVVRCE